MDKSTQYHSAQYIQEDIVYVENPFYPFISAVSELPHFFRAKEHEHTLSLCTTTPGSSWFCRECVATKCAVKHYRCEPCLYDLCLDCIKEDLKTGMTEMYDSKPCSSKKKEV